MRLKTVVILVLTPLVAGFIHFANADSQTALPGSIAQDRSARDKGDGAKSRPPAKETKESPPWNDFLQAAADGNDAEVTRLLKEGAKVDDKSANGWTPLMWAAEAGHTSTVKILTEQGADVNAVGNNGRSALMLAAYRRQDEVVSTLLDNGASPNVADSNGMTALMYACLAGDEKTATALVTKGADVNALDKAGFNPLMKVKNARIVDLLVKHGADVNAKSNDGMTALMTAARNKYTSVIKSLLKQGADRQAKDNNGETATHWAYRIDQGGGIAEPHKHVLQIFDRNTQACVLCQACILGREDLVKKLLNKGVDPNIPCDPCDVEDYKVFPLVEATEAGHVRIVKLLLEKGAVIDDHWALYSAAMNGDFEVVKLLLERGAVPKKPWPDHYGDVCGKCGSKIFGLLLPHIGRNHKGCVESAARRGCSENVKILLGSGVDVNPELISSAATEGNSQTLGLLLSKAKEKGMSPHEFGRALHRAAGHNRSKSVAVLLEHGAEVNQKDSDNKDRTALMTACLNGAVEAARMLIKQGADVNAKDRDGASAMSWSYTGGRADLAKLLKANGSLDKPPQKEKLRIETLAEAVEAGNVKAVEKFLRGGAHPDSDRDGGDTLLHIAAGKGPGSIVKLLIDHGADLEAGIPGGGDTPLLVAVEKGNLGAAQVLLEHGANIKAYVEPQGDSIDTPTALDIASRKKNDKMRQLLLRFGVEYSELMDPKDFK
jgi:ankyrin repeat protein